MTSVKLEKIVEISAKIKLQTGLHIGAGDSEMHIGGIDNSVIKNPITQSPYIPGSSIKGKMRAMLEWLSGEVKEKPLAFKDLDQSANRDTVKVILQLFGASGDSGKDPALAEIGVSRLSFWDCSLDPQWEQAIRNDNMLLTEAKSENTINRISATADNPRQTERVPAGAIFNFKLMLRQFAGDDKETLLNTVLKGLKLLEMDSLGGSGSRGYGKIKFEALTVDGAKVDLPQDPFKA